MDIAAILILVRPQNHEHNVFQHLFTFSFISFICIVQFCHASSLDSPEQFMYGTNVNYSIFSISVSAILAPTQNHSVVGLFLYSCIPQLYWACSLTLEIGFVCLFFLCRSFKFFFCVENHVIAKYQCLPLPCYSSAFHPLLLPKCSD